MLPRPVSGNERALPQVERSATTGLTGMQCGQTVMDLAVNGVPIGQPIKEVR